MQAEAIIFDSDGLRVLVVDGDKVGMQKVSIARDLGTSVELRDGLEGGEQVVVAPPADLTDGQAIKVQAPKSDEKKDNKRLNNNAAEDDPALGKKT